MINLTIVIIDTIDLSNNTFCCIFPTDTYLAFVNSVGVSLAYNDDLCGYGSQISYTVPDGTACATYTLREGKFSNIKE